MKFAFIRSPHHFNSSCKDKTRKIKINFEITRKISRVKIFKWVFKYFEQTFSERSFELSNEQKDAKKLGCSLIFYDSGFYTELSTMKRRLMNKKLREIVYAPIMVSLRLNQQI